MTSRDLLVLVVRRWYVMLIGGLLTLGVTYQATHQRPLFFAQYSVVLLPPRSETYPNSIEDPHYGLAQMAGLLVSDFNGGQRGVLLGSPDTTLFGEGLRSGSRVRLPNYGSQWQPIYDKPNIDVQILGASPAEVSAEGQRINERLVTLLEKRQDELGIVSTMRITSLISPHDPLIIQVGGSRARAILGIGLVGIVSSVVVAFQFDRWRRRRRTAARRPRELRSATPTSSFADYDDETTILVGSSTGAGDQPRGADALQPANSRS